MSLAAAIIKRELFSRVRRKRFYLKRMAFVLIAGFLVLLGFATSSRLGITTTGIQIFSSVSFFLMIAACFAAPWSAAPALAQEREDRTLGLLFLTEMHPWEIVFGKLFPASFSTFVTVLSGLPLLILCVGLGGVSTPQILNGVAILLAAVFLGACLGLAVSSVTRTAKGALSGAIAAGLLLFGAVPAGLRYWGNVAGNPRFEDVILPIVSPFDALEAVIEGNIAGTGVRNCLFDVALGIPFLLLAFVIVPRLALDRKKSPLFTRIGLSRTGLGLRGNPVAWKEQLASLRPRTKWWLFGLSMAGSISAAHILFQLIPSASPAGRYGYADIFIAALAIIAVLSSAAFAIGVIATCSNSFSREKKSRAFELLLITGLSEGEIILGKLWAAAKTCFPWLVSAALTFVLLARLKEYEFASEVLVILAYASLVFGCACLAMYFSLRFRRMIAIGMTTLICVPWIMSSTSALMSAGAAWGTIILNLILAYICLGKLFHRLRQVSSGEKPW